jgi:hypothetical protein
MQDAGATRWASQAENAGSIPVARSLARSLPTPQVDAGFGIAAFRRSLARNDRRAPDVPQRAPACPEWFSFSASQSEDGREHTQRSRLNPFTITQPLASSDPARCDQLHDGNMA